MGAFAGLSVAVRERSNASMSVERLDRQTRLLADVQQSTPVGPGLGYRIQTAGLGTAPALIDGELRAQSKWGAVDVRQSFSNGQASTFAQVTGGLVAIGGRVIATRPVQDGYALVRVPGVPGVRTYLSHQEVGRTDRRGDLLVPNLLAYYGNEVTIADSDVPVDRALDASRMVIAPPFRGGAVVRFDAPRQWRVTGTVVVTGEPDRLAGHAGTRAVLRVNGAEGTLETELGLDGEFYLEGLTPGVHPGEVDLEGSTCTLTLVVPEREAPVLRLGQVACVRAQVRP
jgi:outer membrane usher protein